MKKQWGSFFGIIAIFGALQSAQANPQVIRSMFEDTVMKFFMTQTEAGRSIINDVAGTAARTAKEVCYSCFLQRIEWEQNRALAEELEKSLGGVRTQLKDLVPQIEERGILSIADLAQVNQAMESVRVSKIQSLLTESKPHLTVKKKAFQNSTENAPSISRSRGFGTGEGYEIIEKMSQEIENATLSWPRKLAIRFKAYGKFAKAFSISEGEMKTLFGAAGKNYTASDISQIRRINGLLLAAMNGFTKMRLQVAAFLHESPSLYARLNELTTESTEKYLAGELASEDWIAERTRVANDLKMNPIVGITDGDMLTAIERCKVLGGIRAGKQFKNGQIQIAMSNIIAGRESIAKLTKVIKAEEARLIALDEKLNIAYTDAVRDPINAEILEVERKLLKNKSDRDARLLMMDKEAKYLDELYLEFVKNYDKIDIFVNIRNGDMFGEKVTAFNLPDPLVVDQAQLDSWAGVYGVALDRSAADVIRDEINTFVKSRFGDTRRFVQFIDKSTEKVFGTRFLDTPEAAELQRFRDNTVRTVMKWVLGATGIGGVGYGGYRIDQKDMIENAVKKVKAIWDDLVQEDTTANSAQ